MLTARQIRNDLKDIRYYFSRKTVLDDNFNKIGENQILEKLKLYNQAIRSASPRLYDIYVSLYLYNNTQESLSEKLGYTLEHVSRLNSQLVLFFQQTIEEVDYDEVG